ncbi:hypothetical protein LSH36_782g00017 [Paralvinella palmiformis]|uniref:Uncharacterized protein n=1 Tax=Paralvinella palmiformis TaxID=53620 RepID=A0AAD9MU20_9ANNE|nr:hypothetical protein LSH36_782g00017 [Paralvinella palmiformis]
MTVSPESWLNVCHQNLVSVEHYYYWHSSDLQAFHSHYDAMVENNKGLETKRETSQVF